MHDRDGYEAKPDARSHGFRQQLNRSTFTAIARRARRGCCAASGSARCSPCFPQSSWHTPRKLGLILKASGVSPLLPPTSVQQPWTRRREKLRTRPRRPRTHRLAKRRRRRRRARPPRRRRRRPRRRRPAFGSAHVSQRPQCALARHETAAKLQAIRVAAPSVPGNDKPTGLGHAGLDAGGARLRRARLGLIWERRPPELPGADAV